MPPQLQKTGWQMVVRIIKGEGFPKLETFSNQIDALFTASFAGKTVKTSVKGTEGDDRHCSWYEDLYLPVMIPCVGGKLTLQAFDYDKGGANDFIGQVSF